MKILSLPLGADTGGVSAAIGRAFANEPGWEFRSIISTLNYIDYPADHEWSREKVIELWYDSDLLHLHHNLIAAYRLTSGGWKGFRLPRKPYLVHFHGTGFREDPRGHLNDMRRYRATGVVATLDLWLLAPDQLEWLPCPVHIQPRHHLEDDVLRIAHAPTNRGIKGTEFFEAAVKQLRSEGHQIEWDIIENVTWAECLARKAQADIYYDQVQLGYGNNAIESWGMGIPVVAGAQPATLAEMTRRFGVLPFYRATEATIYDALKALVQSSDLRAEYSEKGLAHVRRFHDEKVVVEQLKRLYRKAAGISEEAAA